MSQGGGCCHRPSCSVVPLATQAFCSGILGTLIGDLWLSPPHLEWATVAGSRTGSRRGGPSPSLLLHWEKPALSQNRVPAPRCFHVCHCCFSQKCVASPLGAAAGAGQAMICLFQLLRRMQQGKRRWPRRGRPAGPWPAPREAGGSLRVRPRLQYWIPFEMHIPSNLGTLFLWHSPGERGADVFSKSWPSEDQSGWYP